MKALLSNYAAFAIQHDLQLSEFCQRKRAEGKKRLVVLNEPKNMAARIDGFANKFQLLIQFMAYQLVL